MLTLAPELASIDHCRELVCDFRRHYFPQALATWGERPRVVMGWYYPPTLAMALRPVVGLGLERAATWWLGVLVACTGLLTYTMAHQLRFLGRRTRWVAALLLVGCSFPIWHALKWGQVSLILASVISFGATLGPRSASAGIGLSSSLKIYPSFIWLALLRDRRAVGLGLGVMALVGAVLPFVLLGTEHSMEMFASSGDVSFGTLMEHAPQGIVLTLARWLPLPTVAGVGAGLAALAILLVKSWKPFWRADLEGRVALALLIVSAGFVPTAWHHSFAFLPWVWSVLWRRSARHDHASVHMRTARLCLGLSIAVSLTSLLLLGVDAEQYQQLTLRGVTTISAAAAWVGLLKLDLASSPADDSERLDSERRARVVIGVAVLAGLAALRQLWLCDDAFISFRYAENLVAGDGLVFVAGERVEGITNLLWTLWIAAGHLLGVSAELWAPIWSILAFAATCALLAHMHQRSQGESARTSCPWAALALALHPDAAVWATSGLETSALLLGIVGAFSLVASRAPGDPPRPVLAGLVTAAAAATRPDAILLAPIIGGLLLVQDRKLLKPSLWNWTRALRYAAALAVIWVPINLARVAYYGDFFPNTYYAKSAYLSWWSQGLIYLQTFYERSGAYLLCVPLFAWWVGRQSAEAGTSRIAETSAALCFGLLYTIYVVRVGGGFMYARLLIPSLPLLFFVFGRVVEVLPRKLATATAALTVLSPYLLPAPVTLESSRRGIADERAFYGDPEFERQWKRRGEVVGYFLAETNARVAFLGADARTMRDAKIGVAVEAETGLTDAVTARTTLQERTRPGHEKRADPAYLIDERRVHFALGRQAYARIGLEGYVPRVGVLLPDPRGILPRGQTLWVLRWDPRIMAELRRRGAVVPDPRTIVAPLVAEAQKQTLERCRDTHRQLRRFYFDQVEDPELAAVLVGRCPLKDDNSASE